MNIDFCKALQDGKLTPATGRIVIYKNFIDVSRGTSRDHNDLLRSLAAKYKLPKDDVISNAIRLYWDYEDKNSITVSPVRKIDEEMFYASEEFNAALIKSTI